MTLDRIVLRLQRRSAEEAVRLAADHPEVGGYAVGPEMLAGPGPALIGAVGRLGRVLALWAVHGAPGEVAAAVSRLAEFGAAWITVHASSGVDAMAAAVEAVRGTEAAIVAVTVEPALGDGVAASLGLGRTRGKAVSRLAAAAGRAGVGAVLCAPSDIGVVAQVAPGTKRFVIAGDAAEVVPDALNRGAEHVVVSAESLDALRNTNT